MKTPHKHAALMAEYAKDAAETERPWERWECKGEAQGCAWGQCLQQPVWQTWMWFRRKPITININGIEVPEPLRVAPEMGTRYFLATTTTTMNSGRMTWDGGACELLWLERGLIHLDRESAETHIRALLSFSQQNQ